MPMVAPEQPTAVVKAGMFILNKGVKGKKLTKLLNKCREHADPEIQKYATHLWRTNTKEGRAVVLMDALSAGKRSDRVKALPKVKTQGQPVAPSRSTRNSALALVAAILLIVVAGFVALVLLNQGDQAAETTVANFGKGTKSHTEVKSGHPADKIANNSDANLGFNAATGEYVNMLEAGIIDPLKVARVALQNATSVASLLLTTEATVSDIKEKTPAAAPASATQGADTTRVEPALKPKTARAASDSAARPAAAGAATAGSDADWETF